MVSDRRVRRAGFDTASALLLAVAAVAAPIALAPAAQAASGSLAAIWAGNVNSAPGATFNYTMTCYAAENTNALDVTVSHPADGSVGAVRITSQYLTCDGWPHAVAISVNSNKNAPWNIGDQVHVKVAQVDAADRPFTGGTATTDTTLTTRPPDE